MRGKYLYGIIKRDENQNLNLDGLTTVAYQSLAAVVGEKEVRDYHKLPKEKTIKELISHQQIIEKIMKQSPILPVRFGTILKDKEEVESVLEKGYFFLRNALQKMEDKIELDLVCFWDEQKAAQMVFQKSKRVQTLQKKLGEKREVSLEEKIALGKLVAQYLGTKKEKLRDQILKTLKKETVESCSHALADVNMLLNQAFLVEKESEESFSQVLNQLDSKLKELVNFRLVGPLSPYSFATVVIDALDREEVEKAKKMLNLDGEINEDKIKKAYDVLAFRLHPDHGGSPIDFELVTQSYKLLRKFVEQGLIGISLYKWEER